VHSLQFGRWSTVLFRYYLLGGNTVAPSGLLARLYHAFLVIETFELLMKSCAKLDLLFVNIHCATARSLEKVNFKV